MIDDAKKETLTVYITEQIARVEGANAARYDLIAAQLDRQTAALERIAAAMEAMAAQQKRANNMQLMPPELDL